jgi:hypothetical protein
MIVRELGGSYRIRTRPVGGGAGGCGTVFGLSLGLAPFVEARPAFARPGSVVTILGTDLAGSNGVSFNGRPAASFSINPTGSAILATVPSGATAGKIQVTTAHRTLSSDAVFYAAQ